jgi:hypothetical protein
MTDQMFYVVDSNLVHDRLEIEKSSSKTHDQYAPVADGLINSNLDIDPPSSEAQYRQYAGRLSTFMSYHTTMPDN